MAKLVRQAVLAAMASYAGAAHAEGWYGQGAIGVSLDGTLDGGVTRTTNSSATEAPFDVELDSAVLGSLAFGHTLGQGWRIEGETALRQNEFDVDTTSGDADAISVLANVAHDFNRDGVFQPYIGAGIGFAQVNIDIGDVGEDDATGFAYQIGAGIGFKLSERFTLDVGYRYFAAPDLSVDFPVDPGETLNLDFDYSQHAAVVGVRW
jgi:OOP family OmpA-OmpF porin